MLIFTVVQLVFTAVLCAFIPGMADINLIRCVGGVHSVAMPPHHTAADVQ